MKGAKYLNWFHILIRKERTEQYRRKLYCLCTCSARGSDAEDFNSVRMLMEPLFVTVIFTSAFRTKLRQFVWRSCFALSVRTLERVTKTGYHAKVHRDWSALPVI